MSNEERLLEEISGKLDRVLGFLAIRGVKDTGEQIARLRSLGMDNQTIAAMTNMTANAIAVRIHRMQKGATKGRKETSNGGE
jgi:hypothetical protein